jgi:hypothetical protein
MILGPLAALVVLVGIARATPEVDDGGATLAGVVRDERGAPVAGAVVHVRSQWIQRLPRRREGLVVTGADGRFALQNLQTKPHDVAVAAAGKLPATVSARLVPGANELVVALSAGGVPVTGVVRDARKRPLAGVPVLLLGDENALAGPRTLTDRRGRFAIQARKDHRHVLMVEAEAFVRASIGPFIVRGPVSHEVTLEPAGCVEGVTQAGKPARPVPFVLVDIRSEAARAKTRNHLQLSDERGRFRFCQLESGHHIIGAEAQQARARRKLYVSPGERLTGVTLEVLP